MTMANYYDAEDRLKADDFANEHGHSTDPGNDQHDGWKPFRREIRKFLDVGVPLVTSLDGSPLEQLPSSLSPFSVSLRSATL